ncbi:MAG: 3-beta hydroxysteroid dehydrogenase/isomerase family-domain-containing protein [Monoraphidium minutum]|nr:MAG: 3-beta hydroxysteroid dehydrogenase/isomerase family-domain-containing protein [Monoraphidium minutum]
MPKGVALVVGGAGFLGRHIAAQLLDSRGYSAVRVFDIRPCGLEGADERVGDLRDAAAVQEAVRGVDVVIHVATATPTSENSLNRQLMDDVNVTGLEHVISACRAAGVRRLVYTSSASVVFEGQDLVDATEALPYASRPMDYYTETKIKGERMALEANGPDLATCALRPSGIFGEGDTVMVPTLVRQARLGKMKYIIGRGDNRWDLTYVGNVAQAHLLVGAGRGRRGGLVRDRLGSWSALGRPSSRAARAQTHAQRTPERRRRRSSCAPGRRSRGRRSSLLTRTPCPSGASRGTSWRASATGAPTSACPWASSSRLR